MSNVLIALEVHQCRKHVVSQLGTVWSHNHPAVAKPLSTGAEDAEIQKN